MSLVQAMPKKLRMMVCVAVVFALTPLAGYAQGSWWNTAWRFRVPVQFASGQVDRIRKPAEAHINFSTLMGQLGMQGKLDPSRIRVVEVDQTGDVVVDTVAFQFDPDVNYNDSTNAAGTLVVLLNGTTPASTQRTYHVYFDFLGQGGAPAAVAQRVTLADGIEDEGQECFTITNASGTIFYQKLGGAFSSWVDKNGNDWVGYNPTYNSEAGGDARGIPNSCYPRGFFHPGASGAAGSISTIAHQGPLKVTVHSILTSGIFECQWDFYPEYARLSMLKTDSAYWILYEGTPGGVMEPDVDFVTRSDGTRTMGSEMWVGDMEPEEWAYFSDPNVDRSLFLFHEENDNIVDQYYAMTSLYPPLAGKMTVFGFGRQAAKMYLYDTPQHFTYGIVDGTNYTPTAALIRSAGGVLTATVGQPEQVQLAPIALVAPPNGATHQSRTPRLSWQAYPSATRYRVQIGRDTLWTPGSIVVDAQPTDTVYTSSVLPASTTLYWRVAAGMASYILPFGGAWHFETIGGLPNQVKLVYPANGGWARHDSVVCRWNRTPGALRYAVEWTSDSLFAYPDMDSTLTDTVAILALDLGRYYWRVRARNEAGWGPYSEIRFVNTSLTLVEDVPETPDAVHLLQNYPNPFNPSTNIQYSLPSAGRVTLLVFNTLGQTVATLVDGTERAGVHSVVFEAAAGIPSGVYFYRLVVNERMWTRAMLLLR
jgi:hypothetical protein